jgi:hypothetical protein
MQLSIGATLPAREGEPLDLHGRDRAVRAADSFKDSRRPFPPAPDPSPTARTLAAPCSRCLRVSITRKHFHEPRLLDYASTQSSDFRPHNCCARSGT